MDFIYTVLFAIATLWDNFEKLHSPLEIVDFPYHPNPNNTFFIDADQQGGCIVEDSDEHDEQQFEVWTRLNNTDLPDEFDSRQKWPACVGPITDQGACNSCYSLVTTDVLSDRMCIKNGGTSRVDLSAIDALSCCENCYNPVKGRCEGGRPMKVFEYVNKMGIVSEQCWSYHAFYQKCDHVPPAPQTMNYPKCGAVINPPQCTDKCPTDPTIDFKGDKRKGTGKPGVIHNDIVAIKQQIYLYGPVLARLVLYRDLMNYQHGIFEKRGYHAVRVLGWGKKGENSFWIVANSLNEQWGKEGGYFKIKFGESGIEEKIMFNMP